MKKVIIYFPYEIKEPKSGSTVRPLKMLNAFEQYCEQHHYELIAIHGESRSRKKQVQQLIKNVNPNEILFTYMENSTLPFWLTDSDHIPRHPFVELKFFAFLKKHNIPLGLFYRDIYWKFDEYPFKGVKLAIMRAIYNLEMKIFNKYTTRLYLPSIFMNRYTQFPINKVSSLPPAGNALNNLNHYIPILSLVYVGGISERYGFKDLILAANLAVEKGYKIQLHVVCRQKELEQWSSFMHDYIDKEWLYIYHAAGKELQEIYQKSNVGIIPIKKNMYNDFAVPVKLFEYMSYGKPIIATNCEAQANIVESDKLGIVVESNVDGLVQGIEYFLKEETRLKHTTYVNKALTNTHNWIHRVDQVAKELMKARI